MIAHAPMGYLIGRGVDRWGRRDGARRASVVAAGVVGGLIPDLDMLRFYLVDGERVLHHSYITHTPFFWGLVAVLLWAGVRLGWVRGAPAAAFVVGTFSHLVLDTPLAGIMWAYPLNTTMTEWVEVTPVFPPHARVDILGIPMEGWVKNFLVHWTFRLELFITACAVVVWSRTRPVLAPVAVAVPCESPADPEPP